MSVIARDQLICASQDRLERPSPSGVCRSRVVSDVSISTRYQLIWQSGLTCLMPLVVSIVGLVGRGASLQCFSYVGHVGKFLPAESP